MTKDRLKEKHQVFEALLQQKKQRFEQMSNFQEEHLQSINEGDLDQNSIVENQTEEMLREVRTENESLDTLKEQINKLEDYKSYQDKDKVGPITVVKTDLLNLVVAVPQRTFEVNGEKYNGVSTDSPIYQALEGKAAGDSVEFNGKNIKVKEVI